MPCASTPARRLCSAAAAARSNTSFVDFRVDSPLAHDASDFLDPTHYRHTLADHMETRIIALLRAGETGAARADGCAR